MKSGKWQNRGRENGVLPTDIQSFPTAAAFLAFLVFLFTGIFFHEPWFDEAQAWLLARDSGLFDLMVKYLRYEGSPGLWHLLLSIPAKLGLPYRFMSIISGVAAAAGVYILMFRSPFPVIIKLLLPFSFFILYQYGMVARSYSLLPFLLFRAAHLYGRKTESPYIYTFVLLLMANVSLHGLVIASGLVFLHVTDLVRQRNHLTKPLKIKNTVSIGIFCISLMLLFAQLKPPPDLISVASFSRTPRDFIRGLENFFPKGMLMLSDSLGTNLAKPAQNRRLFYILSVFITRSCILITLYWLIFRKRLLVFLIPVTGLFMIFSQVYANVWHQGTLFLVWLFALWLSFEGSDMEKSMQSRLSARLMTAAMAAVLLIQVYWSFNAVSFDITNDYSASRDVAEYIKEKKLDDKKIYAVNFHSISILPYFDKNIFCNYNYGKNPSFWIWSPKNTMYGETYLDIDKYDPDVIIIGIKNYSPEDIETDRYMVHSIEGYQLDRFFGGSLYWKDRLLETDSFAVFIKSPDNRP